MVKYQIMVNVTITVVDPYRTRPVSVDQIIHVLVIIAVAFIFIVVFFGIGGAR
jgi:hypothetical protein